MRWRQGETGEEQMEEAIKLNSQELKTTTKGVANDSILACSKTSMQDGCVTDIASNGEQHWLYVDDSIAMPKDRTVMLRILRNDGGTELFAGELDIQPSVSM